MKYPPRSKAQTIIDIILVAMVVALMYVVGYLVLQPKGDVTCASFGSYADALSAYKNGSTWLDNDKEGVKGVPCESLHDSPISKAKHL